MATETARLRDLFVAIRTTDAECIEMGYNTLMTLRQILKKKTAKAESETAQEILTYIEQVKSECDSLKQDMNTDAIYVKLRFPLPWYEHIRSRLFNPKFFRTTSVKLAEDILEHLKTCTPPIIQMALTPEEFEFLRYSMEKQYKMLKYNNEYYHEKRKAKKKAPSESGSGSDWIICKTTYNLEWLQ